MASVSNYEKLETKYAEFVGSKYAVSVSSGTAALHLALIALGVREGDEVIVPDFTMGACAFAVSYVGAKPIFVDCGADLNIDVDLIESAISTRTVAIMAVHIYGRLCNMEKILEIAKKHDLKVLEDACEAQGAVFQSKADISVYSFYKNKIIHAEEGGIVCTNNGFMAQNIKDLKNMAFGEKHDYFHQRIGYNYRMADSQAKRALRSLERFPENIQKRKNVEAIFDKYLESYMPKRSVLWVYDMLVDDQEKVMMMLRGRNVQVRPFFKPLSSMPMYDKPVGEHANFYSKRGIIIPVNPDWGEARIKWICDIIKGT